MVISEYGPDILSGGIVGSASGCNISLCQNRGNIRSETKGWGWPTSANYRHQTGGIVGLFEGGFPAEKAKVIAACENYGNIEVTSFTGYNIANSCCENDDTGGICGGFACNFVFTVDTLECRQIFFAFLSVGVQMHTRKHTVPVYKHRYQLHEPGEPTVE